MDHRPELTEKVLRAILSCSEIKTGKGRFGGASYYLETA